MTYSISKDFTFSASHQLPKLGAAHKCARMHGHNYVVRVEVTAATLDAQGMVCDYAALDPFGAWLAAHVDHRHLNDLITPPTAELLARELRDVLLWECLLPDHVHVLVGVSETPKTWAWYA